MSRDPIQYVRSLELPDAPPRRATRGGLTESAAVAGSFGEPQQAAVVAVGAQLAEFGASVLPGQRSAVADCLLLAQLAANKAAAADADVLAWYARYVEVLQNIGWTTRSMEFKDTSADDNDSGVHKAILPVLTAALGPAMAATSLVISVLKGLQEMDASSPWITIFDRSSTHVRGAKFQLGSVAADAGQMRFKLVALAIEARKEITQVLFFKLSSEHARLRAAEGELDIALDRLESIQAAVAARVQPFLLDNIGRIEL
ncbi:hypothetical protein CKO44_18985 [Rubrivivax gelatinosus]|uniref:Uncharacterized protein n=1 Tax=Rubrivivax gelatinosus TaxID=28068 RepID=A0ABS1E040_RUBGE|nr:hypothetical protein [Rubrivivax gelatinosus]MBK1615551.1 hypothetical protein [Rubrivivax gelatinosus]MBK1715285.1 hypothetical protein [Rubrivivax gelatinosus]